MPSCGGVTRCVGSTAGSLQGATAHQQTGTGRVWLSWFRGSVSFLFTLIKSRATKARKNAWGRRALSKAFTAFGHIALCISTSLNNSSFVFWSILLSSVVKWLFFFFFNFCSFVYFIFGDLK